MASDLDYNLIILAGDRGANDPLAGALGVPRKGLLPLLKRPMLSYVLEAGQGAKLVKNIFVVANDIDSIKDGLPENVVEDPAFNFVEGGKSPVQTVQKVLQNIAMPALLVTADNPLLTPKTLDDFITESAALKCDLAVGFAAKSDVLRDFPDAKRTFIKLGVEGYTGTNMFAMKNDNVFHVLGFWRSIEQQRKKALKLVWAFGFWNLLKVLLGFTNLEKAMKDASRVLKAKVCAIVVKDTALSMDVDKVADIAPVEAVLEHRRQLGGQE